MIDDMVMRSVYLRPAEDTQLRDLAHKLNVTKSDLIRSAISVKLIEWLQSNDADAILRDIEHGRRDEAAIRSGRRGRRGHPAVVAEPVAATKAAPKKAAVRKAAAKTARSSRAELV
jgi:hypothetical protein